MIQHATQDADSIRVPTNDERRADWARKFYGSGYHRTPRKPRIRLPYPDVQITREPVPNCPQSDEFDERTPAPKPNPTMPASAGKEIRNEQ